MILEGHVEPRPKYAEQPGLKAEQETRLKTTRSRFSPARRYASAGTSHGPVSVCLSVCLSQVGVLSKRLNESSWFLARELHLTYPTLCYKKIQVPSKIRVLPSGTLLQTLDLENFATAYRSSKQRVINLARQGGRPERDKLVRRRSAKLTVPSSSDARPLVYHIIIELYLQHNSAARVN